MRAGLKVLAAMVMAATAANAQAAMKSVVIDALITNNADGYLDAALAPGSHMLLSIVVDTTDADSDPSSTVFQSTNNAGLNTNFLIDVLGPAKVVTSGTTQWSINNAYINIVPALPGSGTYLPITVNLTGVGMTQNQILPNFTSGVGGTLTVNTLPLGAQVSNEPHMVVASVSSLTIVDAADTNSNGIDDAVDPQVLDGDSDGFSNFADDCPTISDPSQNFPCDPTTWDQDGDTVVNDLDNCDAVSNVGQTDLDSDGMGDACDVDDDGDRVDDAWETSHGLNPADPADGTTDADSDGVNNLQEYLAGSNPTSGSTSDGDGVGDATDNCPGVSNSSQTDTDSDGLGDACDADKDGDTMWNVWELFAGTNQATADGTGNPDHDGATNLKEFQYDNDPFVFDVALKVRGDYDNDAKSDILFVNTSTGGTYYWPGAVKASAVYPGTIPSGYAYAGTGDFDNDGLFDIFFTKSSNNGTMIWPAAGKPNATYPGTSAAGFSVVGTCDTNGDGADDVVWSNPSTGGTQIWQGAVKASTVYPGSQSTAYSVVACADFDADLKADLFWRNGTTGSNEIWLGAVKASKLYPGAYTDLTWSVVGAGDTNGDGYSDLVWYKASTGSTMIWGKGLKSISTYPGTNATTFSPAAIGDYDGNGTADLLWSNATTKGTAIWPGVVKASATYPGTYGAGFSIQK